MISTTRVAATLLITSLLALSGCGGSGGDTPSLSPLPTLTSGSWKTKCSYDGDYTVTYMLFSEDMFFETKTYYLDSDCTAPSHQIIREGSYLTGPQDPTKPAGAVIDKTYQNYTLTPLSTEAVTLLNDTSVCGFTDWAEGVEKTIIGNTDCGSLSINSGEILYDIYRIESLNTGTQGVIRGDLLFGFKNDSDPTADGTTPESRLKEFSHIFIYRR